MTRGNIPSAERPYTLVIDGQLIGFYPTKSEAENAVTARAALRRITEGPAYVPSYKITYEGRK